MIIPTGFAQANFKFTGAAVPTGAEVTMGLFVDTFTGDPEAAADAAANAWGTALMQGLQTIDITLSSVLVKFGPNATGPSFERPTGIQGTQTDATAAPNLALLVRKNTSGGGRTGRGRFYIPGVSEDDINEGGVLSGGYLSLAVTACNDFHTELVAADLTPALLHSAGSPVQQPLPITSFSPDATAATQRRRMRR